jgi:hypothetical protein|tara:strand:- start:2189 stop:3367 length:1179 start_codon:yes stop_codon:yes gene_type:complete
MIFQTLDDKSECVGVYVDGQLHFDNIPDNLTTTWRYSGSLAEKEIEFIGLWTNGLDLDACCPEEHAVELRQCQNKLQAYLKSFKIAKVNMKDHCVFDMIPQDFLMRFCEIKNKITKHVSENWEKPKHYDHLSDVSKLLHKIKYQNLNLSTQDCRHLLTSSRDRDKAMALISNYRQIEYNLFGTVTGRLTTSPGSFPILTLRKDLRQILKPQNDLFVCLDYNGAEVRTLLELCGEDQPNIDIHQWNSQHLFEQGIPREECKVRFFAWLYDPTSKDIKSNHYDRKKVLDNWYKDGYINTPYGRKIRVEERKALNYLLQSTTSDRVLSKAVKIDALLVEKNCQSYISHIVHDEIVLDYSDGDRKWIPQIKEIFEDGYLCNLTAGKDYYNLKELKV